MDGPLLYDPNAANYDSEAQKIVASNPAAYVIIDLPNTYGKVASALLRTGKWKTSDAFIAGGYPATIPSGIPPETLNGVTGVSPGFPLGGNLVKAFNALWAKFIRDFAAAVLRSELIRRGCSLRVGSDNCEVHGWACDRCGTAESERASRAAVHASDTGESRRQAQGRRQGHQLSGCQRACGLQRERRHPYLLHQRVPILGRRA